MVSIKKNYFYNLFYQILIVLIPLFTVPYLSRVLGVSNIGISSYTFSIVSYFVLFGGVGVASYGHREIAMNRDDLYVRSKIFWELFLFKAITSILSLILYGFFVFYNESYQIIYLILSLNIFASIFDISWFYQGLEDYKLITIRNVVIKVLFTLLIFVFVKNESDFVYYILLNSLSLIFSSFCLWGKLFSLLTKVSFKDLDIFCHLKSTFIYFLPQVATQIYTMTDKTMLGIMTGGTLENGYYEQAHKIVILIITVISSFNMVMLSRMSYLYKENQFDEIRNRLMKSLQLCCFVAFPMAFGIASISYGFVDWFFGIEFLKVKLLLVIFSFNIIFIALNQCLGAQCLLPCGMRAKSSLVLWIGAFLNFGFNLLLIPRFYSLGAVISSIIAEGFIVVMYFILSREFVCIRKFFRNVYKYFVASFVMMVFVLGIYFVLPVSFVSTMIEIIFGVLVYFLCLFIFKDKFLYEIIDLIFKGKKLWKKS